MVRKEMGELAEGYTYREGGQQQKNYYSTRDNKRKVITGLAKVGNTFS